MTTSEKIGTLWPLNYVVDWPIWAVAAFAFMATPGTMFVIYLAVERRSIPWRPSEQFLSFLPGDLVLGAGFVYAVWLANWLPSEYRFYNSWQTHVIIAAIFLVAFVVLYWGGFNSYTTSQMLSPSKLYHDFLYFWYGYLVASTWFVVMMGRSISITHKLGCTAVLLIWVAFLVYDNTHDSGQKKNTAHVNFDWSTFTSSRPTPS